MTDLSDYLETTNSPADEFQTFRLFDLRSYPIDNVLNILLQDKSTKKNIIWATDAYQPYGTGCRDKDHITPKILRKDHHVMIVSSQIKTRISSNRMKSKFADDSERLNHIFANQVYGLAPTEIIYRISRSYILGFTDMEIKRDNIRQFDALSCAKDGTLGDCLERVFSDGYTAPESDFIETEIDSSIVVGDVSRPNSPIA